MTEELPPIVCMTCGRITGRKWSEYQRLLGEGMRPGQALNTLGVTRYCCRSSLLSPARIVSHVEHQRPGERVQVQEFADLIAARRDLQMPVQTPLQLMQAGSTFIQPDEAMILSTPAIPGVIQPGYDEREREDGGDEYITQEVVAEVGEEPALPSGTQKVKEPFIRRYYAR